MNIRKSQSPLMNLAKGGSLVFAGTMLANIGSYLYHLVMGRLLGPAGYGELSSLISLLYLFSVPTLVIQTVLVKYFSEIKASGSLAEAHDLYKRSIGNLVYALLGGAVIILCFSPFIGRYLRLGNIADVGVLYLFFLFSTLAMVNGSLFQGLQRFGWYALFLTAGIFLKLMFSIPVAGLGVSAVLTASVVSALVLFGIFTVPLRSVFSVPRKRFQRTRSQALKFAVPTLLTLLGITSIYSTDIIMAKHFLSASDAGAYAAISVLGKVIFYASSAGVGVLYPVVSERVARNFSVTRIVLSGVLAIACVSTVLTGIYMTVPSFMTHLLFGTAYDRIIPYLGAFAVFISLFSVFYVLVMSLLAMNYVRVWILVILAAILQIAGIQFNHSGIRQIITVNIIVSAALLVGVSVMFYAASMRSLTAHSRKDANE
jgi:O-antigen/teichoic acid export membrane protein